MLNINYAFLVFVVTHPQLTGMAFVSDVPGYQGYMPLMHGQPMTHNQAGMHGQPMTHYKAALHGQPMMNNQASVHGQSIWHGQMQQTISNRDVPQQSYSFFEPEAPSATS